MRLILAAFLALTAMPALACGMESDCRIGERSYRLYVPDTAERPTGAILFAHGYRGSAAGAMRNGGFMRLAEEFGLAFVALDAGQPSWRLAHHPSNPARREAEEYGYLAAVLDDLDARIGLDRDRTVLTGFSSGGMFTWTMICGLGEDIGGYVPYAGTFWAPVPETCPATPASVVHIHGTTDRTVPLAGRPIGEARQGDVIETLEMYGAHGGFGAPRIRTAPGDMTCAERSGPNGRILDFCTFEGGHSFSMERLRHGLARILSGT